LLAAFRGGRVPWSSARRAAAHAARAAALDAVADRPAGPGLRAGGRAAGAGDRPHPGPRRGRGAGHGAAGVRPGGVAWLHHAAADERAGLCRRLRGLGRTARLVRAARDIAAAGPLRRAAAVRARAGAGHFQPAARAGAGVFRPPPAAATAADRAGRGTGRRAGDVRDADALRLARLRRGPGLCAAVAAGRGLRGGRGAAREVPPAGGAGARRRGGAGVLRELRVAFRARLGRHPVAGGSGDHHRDPAGPALVAQARRRLVARSGAGALAPLPRRRGGGGRGAGAGGAGLRGDAASGGRLGLELLPGEGLERRRRAQRGQRDPGGFPRLRHLGRDHRAGDRGAERVRAAAPLPRGGRERGRADAATSAGGQARGRLRRRTGRLPAHPRPDRAVDGAGDRAVRRAPVPARTRPARRWLRRRHHGVGGAGAAVHGARRALGGDAAEGGAAALDRPGPAAGAGDRTGRAGIRPSVPQLALAPRDAAARGRAAAGQCAAVRPRRVRRGGGRHFADAGGAGPPVAAATAAAARCRRGGRLMELVLALAIGVLGGGGAWLLLRPRTFQVIMGLSLLSYAVNLFIFCVGGLRRGADPVLRTGAALTDYADPLPQALVLTAIVIGFATTALFLVVLLASRGLTGSDHVDGKDAAP